MKMHDDEVDINSDLVRRLVTSQFPALADLPITEFSSTGTVNAIYRIGEDLCARLPRVERWARGLQKELKWLPYLTPGLTLRVPEPIRPGQPTPDYPFTWAIFRWINGQTYAEGRIDDERQAAADLAQFVAELRRTELPAVIDDDTPLGGRLPLIELDADTRKWISGAAGIIDVQAAIAAWERSLQAPAWDGTYVWIHGDLLPPNLLVDGGRLRAVIDFGGSGLGDPATDLNPAWSVFSHAGRTAFRTILDVDNDTWRRGRGIALTQALGLIPYYAVTNPGLAALGRRMLREILTDMDASP
jgi:aminoglycoside phosphotransferase (APT) family kinase protein